MGSCQDIWNKFEKWCRLAILVQAGGESVCKDILKELKVPEGGKDMYEHLKDHKIRITNSKKMFPFQKKALLPDSEDIDTTKLDIALFTHIIEILDDPSKPKYPRIKELRFKRNELFHMKEDQRDMSELEFDNRWNEVSQLFTNLITTFDMSTLSGLKNDNLFSNPDQKKILEDTLVKGSLKYFFYQSCECQSYL